MLVKYLKREGERVGYESKYKIDLYGEMVGSCPNIPRIPYAFSQNSDTTH